MPEGKTNIWKLEILERIILKNLKGGNIIRIRLLRTFFNSSPLRVTPDGSESVEPGTVRLRFSSTRCRSAAKCFDSNSEQTLRQHGKRV